MVASLATEAGKRVAMVYRPPYGSTCLITGCVPSKFMLHRACVAHEVRTAARYHVAAIPPTVDFAAIVREKQQLVTTHRAEAFRAAQADEHLTLVEGSPRRPKHTREGGETR